MKILIIEDEPRSAEMITRLLRQYDNSYSILAIIDSVEKGIQWFTYKTETPDLILADIQLTDGTSFDLFDQLNLGLPVIFITAYNEFVMRAFTLNSIDYLLKPLNFADLKKALDKFNRTKEGWLKSDFAKLKQILSDDQKLYKHRFLVKSGNSYKSLSANDISIFISENDLVFAFLNNGTRSLIDDNISVITRSLDPEKFFRVNRSTIINITAIEKISGYFNRRLIIRLFPGNREVIVSRERVRDFKNWLNK